MVRTSVRRYISGRCCLSGIVFLLFSCLPVFAHAQRTQNVTSFAMPAWVQAVGTIVALLVVVLIMGWQYRSYRRLEEGREKAQLARELEHETAEIRSILCSARHELAFFYMTFREGTGELLEDISEGGYLDRAVPVEHERYYVYPICASNIGKVRDALLGRQILHAYTMQIRFVEAMKWNNNLLRWLREARKRQEEHNTEDGGRALSELLENLREHFPKMLAAFDEMEMATKTVLEYINEDGTINPRSRHKLHSRYYFLNSPQSVRYR